MSQSNGRSREPIRCASGTWSSDAAYWLVEVYGGGDPVEAMRRAASRLLAESEVTAAPTDLELVGSFRGVTQVAEAAMEESGRLLPVPGGYRIEVNASQSRGRQRFSHAHEIGHLLVPTYCQEPKRRDDSTTGEYRPKEEEEFLCDVAATEILMPVRIFRSAVSGREAGVRVLSDVASNFEVSLEAAGVRLAQNAADELAVIVWEETLKSSQSRQMETQAALPGMEEFQPQPRLRIRFGATSADLRDCFFPPEKSAEDGCLVCTCLDTEGVVRGECNLPTGRGAKRFWTESVRAPYRRGETAVMRVITVARPA